METFRQGFRRELPTGHAAHCAVPEGTFCLSSGAPILEEITQTCLTHCNKNGYQSLFLAGIATAFTNP